MPLNTADVRNCIGVPFAFAAHVQDQAALEAMRDIRQSLSVDDNHYRPLAGLVLGDSVPEQSGANGISARQTFKFDCANHWRQKFGSDLADDYWRDKWGKGGQGWTLDRIVNDLSAAGAR